MARFSVTFELREDFELFKQYSERSNLSEYLDSWKDLTLTFRTRTDIEAYDIRGMIVKSLKSMNVKFTTS